MKRSMTIVEEVRGNCGSGEPKPKTFACNPAGAAHSKFFFFGGGHLRPDTVCHDQWVDQNLHQKSTGSRTVVLNMG